MTGKPTVAFLVQIEENYGTVQMTARPVYVVGGELLNPQWPQYGACPCPELADMEIGGYLREDKSGTYSPSVTFAPHRVKLEQAESIVKVLRKVHKGLDRLNDTEGYLPDGDFAGYVFRVARILGIGTYYVRNTKRAAAVSGERFRLVDGVGVQSYVSARISEGKVA
jgi:hypothetical protein